LKEKGGPVWNRRAEVSDVPRYIGTGALVVGQAEGQKVRRYGCVPDRHRATKNSGQIGGNLKGKLRTKKTNPWVDRRLPHGAAGAGSRIKKKWGGHQERGHKKENRKKGLPRAPILVKVTRKDEDSNWAKMNQRWKEIKHQRLTNKTK